MSDEEINADRVRREAAKHAGPDDAEGKARAEKRHSAAQYRVLPRNDAPLTAEGQEFVDPDELDQARREVGVDQAEAVRQAIDRKPADRTATPQPATQTFIHVVQAGETLASIAEAYYGEADRWQDVYAANRDAIGADPNRVYPGLQLMIPDAEMD